MRIKSDHRLPQLLAVVLALGSCGRSPAKPGTGTTPGQTRTVSFEYKGGSGELSFVTVNGQPQGVRLEPGESYFGTLGQKLITHKDGVLCIGEQRFPGLPPEAKFELLNGEVFVNGEFWGRLED